MATTIYGSFFPITPSDGQNLPSVVTGIYVGGAGVIVVQGSDGVDVTFVATLAGTVLPIQAKRVKASGTTATNLVGLVG